MSNLIIQIRDALIEAGTTPNKSLSQSFLMNEGILEKQIQYADLSKEDSVLEIGGGTGILTEKLAEKAQKVFCIEYDSLLASYLRSKFKTRKNITIIEGDALKLDFPEVTKVVANLPYHISSPLTFKLLDYKFTTAILMYQYEFAQRMVAKPNTDDYSRLTINLHYQAEVEILERVPRNYFYPMPKVDSAIVKVKPKPNTLPIEPKYYRNVSRILFNTKNKIISSVLYDYFKRILPKTDREMIRSAITNIRNSNLRVRELTVELLVELSKDLVHLAKSRNIISLLNEDEFFEEND